MACTYRFFYHLMFIAFSVPMSWSDFSVCFI
jgi:hypothetical protein